jgi:inward rectifier potassium channel
MPFAIKKITSPIRNTTILVNAKKELDLYHTVLQLSWLKFNLLFVLVFFWINLIFGFLYWLTPDSIGGMSNTSYLNYFFFSVHTLATIGYGNMFPQTLLSNVLVTFESMVGLLSLGLFAAVSFSRLSLPRALIAFSDKAVITQHNGKPTLMIRLANNRGNSVIDAQITLSLFKQETTSEGSSMMRIHDLKLHRNTSPLLLLTWLVMHTIDEESPLHGLNEDDLQQADITLLATVTGLDETLSQTIHAKTTYQRGNIYWNTRFKDLFKNEAQSKSQFIDLSELHSIEEIETV